MNKCFFNYFLVVIFVLLSACKKKDGEKISNSVAGEVKELKGESVDSKSYSEISIAQGGEWNGRVYENGRFFKNVQSLKVPQSHTDHSWYIRYEGPGWESNKIGYRLYLDWRNAIDIFGKVTDSIILPKVGQDGFDSYHESSDWGMDILKVGKGLGIGSIGRFVNNEMLHFQEVDSTKVEVSNSKENSSIAINYYGWKTTEDKIDLASQLTIAPNQRITKHTIQPSIAISNICTGIVKHGVEYFSKESKNNKWGYIATYGEQTLVPDNLGMAVFYEVASVEKVTEWEYDYLLLFKPTSEKISYYFLGAWEQEPNGIKTKDEFLNYLDSKLIELNDTNKL